MAVAGEPYIQEREGVLYVGGTRVTLGSLIGAWQSEGYTAEEAQEAFPVLSLAQVYGAIAYYLERRPALDATFRQDAEEYERRRAQGRQERPDFYRSLDERKARLRQQLEQQATSLPDGQSHTNQ